MSAQPTYALAPIGFVRDARARAEDDYWGDEVSSIVLTGDYSADALRGLTSFSHVEIVYLFHLVPASSIVRGVRRPRDNPAWPEVGIFAQRARSRPNRLGVTICRLARVEGPQLQVLELDAVDGTPVLDIKPVMSEFLPRGTVRQPEWSRELMRDYWRVRGAP